MSAGIWRACALAGTEPGERISVGSGNSWVRFMGPQYILDDGDGEYGIVGWGVDIIDDTGSASLVIHPTYYLLGF